MSPLRIPLISYILRIGLGFAYISTTILSFYSPELVFANLPSFIQTQNALLPIFIGIVSMCMAGWILSGKTLLASSTISLCIVLAFLIGNVQKPFIIFVTLQTLCLNIALILCQKLETPSTTNNTDTPIKDSTPTLTTPPEEPIPTLH